MLRNRDVQVVKRTTLNGTIDGHDPLVVVFRIHGPNGWFRLAVVYWNCGRGYTPQQLFANIDRVFDATEERKYVVVCLQEIDEADKGREHPLFKAGAPEGSTFVEWSTREPIIVWPKIDVTRERKALTMPNGVDLGVPFTGPDRYFVSCIAEIEDVVIGFGNQHPHHVPHKASSADKRKVEKAKVAGELVTTHEVADLVRLCDLSIYGGDMNDLHYPKSHPKEKVAFTRGLDTIRYTVA